MSEKFLDQSGLAILRNWVLAQIQDAQLSGGSGGSGDALLVWENSSPTSSFSAQKVSITFPIGYYGVVIAYAVSTDNMYEVLTRDIPFYEGDLMLSVGILSGQYGGRCCTVLPDGVLFGDAYNHASSTTNTIAVPLAIYAVSYARKLTIEDDISKTWIIKPRDISAGAITGFSPSRQKNGNAVARCGWEYSDLGTGFTLVTQGQTNSYAIMISDEDFTLNVNTTLIVKGVARCYNGYDYVGLISKNNKPSGWSSESISESTLEALMVTKHDLVSSSNVFTPFTWSFEVTSTFLGNNNSSRDFYLAAMCAGSNTTYNGRVCITEAYTTSNEAQVSDL